MWISFCVDPYEIHGVAYVIFLWILDNVLVLVAYVVLNKKRVVCGSMYDVRIELSPLQIL